MEKVLVADSSKCSGCRYCEVACSFQHTSSCSYSGSRVRVVRNDHDCSYMPVFCQQCDSPACLEACPTGAIARDETGRVVIAEDLCNGCLSCTTACPFSVSEDLSLPMVHPEKEVTMICDLCGGDPLCARMCPTGTLKYLPRSEAKAFAKMDVNKVRSFIAGAAGRGAKP